MKIFAKAVLFDAGNTLLRINYKFLRDCLRENNNFSTIKSIEISDYLTRVKLDQKFRNGKAVKNENLVEEYISIILNDVGVTEETAIKRIMAKVLNWHEDNNLWNIVNDGVFELLEILQKTGFSLGVISNSEGKLASLLTEHGLSDYFTFIIDSTLVGFEKPDPEIFQMASDELEINPKEAVYIGDIYSIDVVGANRAGFQSILLDPIGAWNEVECQKAKNLEEIHKWVLNGNLGLLSTK